MVKDKPVIEVESHEETAESREQVRQRIQLEGRQRELLLNLVDDETLPSHAISFMIDLGILAPAEDLVPCRQDGRRAHWVDYHNLVERYRERQRNPPPPRTKPLTWDQEWEDRKTRMPPNTGEYVCPVLSLAHDWEVNPPVACVEARETQRSARGYVDNPDQQALLDDPEDPVNELKLRPCRVLAQMLIDGIFVTLGRRDREAEERRWPQGKPKA